jgi:signal recognition particle receptor subunit beta
MALIDLSNREIYGKIVYYGPAFGGKTTNLEFIHGGLPNAARGELHSIATEHERTLFFDYLPLDLGETTGFTIRYQLYTVPGQPSYERTRQAVLTGADGVVFVADAQADRLADNQASLDELRQNLLRQGRPLETMPLVMQYNKLDQPTALRRTELDQHLNPAGVPAFESVAINGIGVTETLRTICQLVTRAL